MQFLDGGVEVVVRGVTHRLAAKLICPFFVSKAQNLVKLCLLHFVACRRGFFEFLLSRNKISDSGLVVAFQVGLAAFEIKVLGEQLFLLADGILVGFDLLRRFQLQVVGIDCVDDPTGIVNDILVRHELYVARFYRARDQFPGTIARIEFALEKYPDSGLEPEALILLGETYLMMKRPDDAQLAFTKVLETYPESAFTTPARNFLAFIGETR